VGIFRVSVGTGGGGLGPRDGEEAFWSGAAEAELCWFVYELVAPYSYVKVKVLLSWFS